jgi:hypothetical protein
MKSAKETVIEILNELPENSSLEEIRDHIYIREKLEKGLEEIKKGKVTSQSDIVRRISKWFN